MLIEGGGEAVSIGNVSVTRPTGPPLSDGKIEVSIFTGWNSGSPGTDCRSPGAVRSFDRAAGLRATQPVRGGLLAAGARADGDLALPATGDVGRGAAGRQRRRPGRPGRQLSLGLGEGLEYNSLLAKSLRRLVHFDAARWMTGSLAVRRALGSLPGTARHRTELQRPTAPTARPKLNSF